MNWWELQNKLLKQNYDSKNFQNLIFNSLSVYF